MGRYSAPQIHHEDENDAMDWEVIPADEEDEHDVRQNNNGGACENINCNHANDYQSLVRRVDNGTASGMPNGDTIYANVDGLHIGGDESSDRVYGAHHMNNMNNSHNEALQIAEEQYMNQHLEQQLSERRRSRMRTFTVILVAILAIVLKRHAPPPPPLLNQSLLDTFATSPTLESEAEADINRAGQHSTDQLLRVTQHETWASYTKHLLHLLHHALTYGLSVAWYSISNALCYTWEEISDAFHSGDIHYEIVRNNWKERILTVRTFWSKMMQPNNEVHDNSQQASDELLDDMDELSRLSSACPIRIPAANNRATISSREASSREDIMEGWSTEDQLRQTIGVSLSPQNLALQIIAESLDGWGKSLIEGAPVALVRKMTTAISTRPDEPMLDEETLAQWILPPAASFLLVGSNGVGKLHIARRVARLLLGHCINDADQESINVGVLEIIAEDNSAEAAQTLKETIVDHIHTREGLGAVIIIHHIELIPMSVLLDIGSVLGGQPNTLSYELNEELVEANTDGTVFLLTSTRLGSKSIFTHIQRNDGVKRLNRESLVSSVELEVDSHLDNRAMLASHSSVVPILPFQLEDLSSIMQGRIQTLNLKYQDVIWKNLLVSLAAVRFIVGVDNVEYLDLYSSSDDNTSILTFSAGGAHALDSNGIWQALRVKLESIGRRPGMTLKVGLSESNSIKETTFSWCKRQNGLEICDDV